MDAVTGEIIKIDKDQSDDDLVGDDDKHQNVNKGVNISRDEAVAIALEVLLKSDRCRFRFRRHLL